MGFYEIDDSSSSNELDLVWLNEYIDENGKTCDGQIYVVDSVKSTMKGFIVQTESFQSWIWRKSKAGIRLLELLNDAVQKDSYPQLVIKISLKNKDKHVLGCVDDSSCEFVFDGESKTYSLHPQKNLPLDITPSSNADELSASSLGNGHRQPAVPPSALPVTSQVQSSQKGRKPAS